MEKLTLKERRAKADELLKKHYEKKAKDSKLQKRVVGLIVVSCAIVVSYVAYVLIMIS